MSKILLCLLLLLAFTTVTQAQTCSETLAYYVASPVEGAPADIVSQTVCSGQSEVKPLAEQFREQGAGLGAWSSTGRAVVYAFSTLYVFDKDNPTPMTVFADTEDVYYTSPSWSPDAQQLAVVEYQRQDKTNWLTLTDLAGNSRRIAQLSQPEPEEMVILPVTWSPGGAWISYTRSRQLKTGEWDANIELLSTACIENPAQSCESHPLEITDESGERPLIELSDNTTIPELWWGAAWSPDGKQLAFWCGANLCFLNVDGSDFRRLDLEFHGHSLTWSPSGEYIAYTSAENDIYVYDLEQHESLNVTQTPDVEEFSPIWIPLPEGDYLFESFTQG